MWATVFLVRERGSRKAHPEGDPVHGEFTVAPEPRGSRHLTFARLADIHGNECLPPLVLRCPPQIKADSVHVHGTEIVPRNASPRSSVDKWKQTWWVVPWTQRALARFPQLQPARPPAITPEQPPPRTADRRVMELRENGMLAFVPGALIAAGSKGLPPAAADAPKLGVGEVEVPGHGRVRIRYRLMQNPRRSMSHCWFWVAEYAEVVPQPP